MSEINCVKFHEFSIMLKIIQSYGLNNIGLPELVIAMSPILMAYSYGIFHLYIFLWPIVALLCLHRKYRKVEFRPLTYVIIFYIIHHAVLILLLMLKGRAPSYLYNSFLGTTIILCSIPFVMHALDLGKLKGALNWVCLFSIGGMIYHFFVFIQSGQIVKPIQLPFLPNPDSTSRIFSEYLRPVSFYQEPAAYCGFVVVPLCLAIYENKIAYAVLITISMFLSTSTTGIAMSVIVWMGATLTRTRFIYRIVYVILGIGLLYCLFHSTLFDAGVAKLNNTKIEETARLSNGPNIIKSMPLEYWVLGAPYPNVYDYSRNANVENYDFIYETDEGTMLYISTFWNLIFQFGIMGLILYLNVYYKIYLNDKMLLPYILVVLITMFSDPTMLGSTYAFQLTFMFTFMKRGQAMQNANINRALS